MFFILFVFSSVWNAPFPSLLCHYVKPNKQTFKKFKISTCLFKTLEIESVDWLKGLDCVLCLQESWVWFLSTAGCVTKTKKQNPFKTKKNYASVIKFSSYPSLLDLHFRREPLYKHININFWFTVYIKMNSF